MAVNTTFDFDQMLSNAREAYGEELMRMVLISYLHILTT